MYLSITVRSDYFEYISKVSSYNAMEVEGFKRILAWSNDLPVKVVATDRHSQISKEMAKSAAQITHQFDVWHLAKNIRQTQNQRPPPTLDSVHQ